MSYGDEYRNGPPGWAWGVYLLPHLEQSALASRYRWDVSWGDPPNQPAVNTQLPVWQCPLARANRVHDGSLLTVTPPPVESFNGTAACGDYAGMSALDAGLVRAGVIAPPGGPKDEKGNYAHPALVGTRIYLRGNSSVICLDLAP